MQFNALYCLSRPEVHTLSCGVARPSDFDEHMAALEHCEKVREVVAPVEQRLQAEMERMLGADWCRRWPEGLPQYVDVPGEVNVLEILRLWTFAKSLDLVSWGKMRYNLLGQGDHWFPGENAGVLKDGELDVCLKDSPFRKEIPARLREAHQMLFDRPLKRLSEA